MDSGRPRTLLLPPLPYALALLGGWWLDRDVARIPLDLGIAGRGLAWLLAAAGFGLFAWALATLWRHHTTVNPYKAASELATDGPFRFTRNPIYLGDWLLFAGVALLLKTAWPLVFGPIVWLAIRYGVIRHEEAHLETHFGETYLAYRKRVPRWLGF